MDRFISDNNAPAYGRTRQCDTDRPMNESGKGKLEEDELRFDSGIVSENFSENFSETDLEPSTSAEFVSKSDSSVTELPKVLEEKLSLSQEDMGVDEMDSGIDIRSKPLSSESVRWKEKSPKPEVPRGGIWQILFDEDEDGDTALHIAVQQKNGILLRKILSCVPHSRLLDIQNYCNQTSLHLSVLMDQPRITRLLVLAGARQDYEDKYGNTALHLACSKNNVQCLKALLEPVTPYEETYIKFRYQPVISRPSEYINESNYNGDTCAHIAAKNNNIEILHNLIMHGADVNIGEYKGGNTVLHEAAQWGDYKLVGYLLRHRGLDVNKKNYARLTAFQLASCYPLVQELLLYNGAEPEIRAYDESSEDSDDYSDSDAD